MIQREHSALLLSLTFLLCMCVYELRCDYYTPVLI